MSGPLSNPLKLTALRWAYARVHGLLAQIPWDEVAGAGPGRHFALARGSRQQIGLVTERGCRSLSRARIEAWMQGDNAWGLRVGIDDVGLVFRVLDEASQLSGYGSLAESLGAPCGQATADLLTREVASPALSHARAGDLLCFPDGRLGLVVEAVTDADGRLTAVQYIRSTPGIGPEPGVLAPEERAALFPTPYYRGPRPGAAVQTPVTVLARGRALAAVARNGRVLVPVDALAEALGGALDWREEAGAAGLKVGYREVRCQAGSPVGMAGGRGFRLDEPPVLADGRLVAPLEFLAGGLGLRVQWRPGERLVEVGI